MNAEMEMLIDSLVDELPEAEKNEARSMLSSCEFQGTQDPIFVLLRYLRVREKGMTNKERPLVAQVRKLAEEMDCRLWEARRYQWGFFVGCVALALFLGHVGSLCLTFYGARTNPVATSKFLGLPPSDQRGTELENGGIGFRVQATQRGYVAVGLTGHMVRSEVRTNGEIVLLFQKAE